MWEIAIDKWTRNWNFYREQLTDNILSKFNLDKNTTTASNRRLNRVNRTEYKCFRNWTTRYLIEHYDCDVEEISNVNYYELSKISTCKLKPLDLEMNTAEVQLLSKARAFEIKA